jgi:hypothetical protein
VLTAAALGLVAGFAGLRALGVVAVLVSEQTYYC